MTPWAFPWVIPLLARPVPICPPSFSPSHMHHLLGLVPVAAHTSLQQRHPATSPSVWTVLLTRLPFQTRLLEAAVFHLQGAPARILHLLPRQQVIQSLWDLTLAQMYWLQLIYAVAPGFGTELGSTLGGWVANGFPRAVNPPRLSLIGLAYGWAATDW